MDFRAWESGVGSGSNFHGEKGEVLNSRFGVHNMRYRLGLGC